jgi:DNA-binding cell septation regulator SpoVG
MAQNQISISNWKPVNRGALRGFATVGFPSGMTLHEVCVFATNGKFWASPPSKPMLDRDGRVMVDDAGKRRYAAIIEFVSKETRDRWSEAVVAALLAAHPEALDE